VVVLAHGFDSDMIAGLVHQGLATAQRDSMKGGRQDKFLSLAKRLRARAEEALTYAETFDDAEAR
jgi:hypothetical protein